VNFPIHGIKGQVVLRGVATFGALLMLTTGQVMAAGEVNGLTLPPPDPAVAFVAPSPDQANYAARLQVFLQATVPDTWNGQPVQFLSTYNDLGGADALGLPASAPKADPNNPNFIYQRFERGALFYNASEGSTTVLT
jgi:uncharacterized protein with LGFP repeats